MSATTFIGSWNSLGDTTAISLEETVGNMLGEYYDDYDVDAIVAECRDAINDALPSNVWLVGDQFLGSRNQAYRVFEGEFDIQHIVDNVDFWVIAEKYDRSA